MLYLLDANVLIRAHEDYYGLEQVPQFWDWLRETAAAGIVKMPYEIHDEIAVSTGPLKNWITRTDIKEALILAEEVDATVLNEVLAQGYAPDLTDSEVEKIGRDPFLISYARMAADRIVVTKEVSRPSAQRANRPSPRRLQSFWRSVHDRFRFLQSCWFQDEIAGACATFTRRRRGRRRSNRDNGGKPKRTMRTDQKLQLRRFGRRHRSSPVPATPAGA